MKRILSGIFVVAIMVAAVSLYAADADSSKRKGTIVAETKVEGTAVVRNIDLEKRKLTLAMPNGALKTFVIDERVKRFDKIQPGDVVNMTYSEAVTVKLRKTKIKPGVTVEASLTPDPEKIKPAGQSHRQVTTTATIMAIAKDFRTVSLKGPDGNVEDVAVRNLSSLNKLKSGLVKVGDQIDITYTQALALSVEKVEQANKP